MSISLNSKIIRDFGKAAATYDNYAILQRNVADKLFGMLQEQIVVQNILDIGCGTGYFHELLRKNKIYAPLVQLDISPQMCNVAANYASPPEYGGTYTCAADMHNIPFSNEIFSAIFSSMTMQWAIDLNQVFKEAVRILEPEGNFAFSIVGSGSLMELSEAYKAAGKIAPIHNFYTQNEIEIYLKQVGFNNYKISNENITMNYKDIYSLLRSIKGVGASYKGNLAGGIKGKSYFTEIEKAYHELFSGDAGLQATWNIVYVTGCK